VLIERPEWVESGMAASERAIVGTGLSAHGLVSP
jgi:hypothetical protein